MKLPLNTLFTSLIFISLSNFASADLRSDAIAQVKSLKSDGIPQKLPEEFLSVDSSLATAEMLYNLKDLRSAEKYYRMVLQKSDTIRIKLSSEKQDSRNLLKANNSSTLTGMNEDRTTEPKKLPSSSPQLQKQVSHPSAEASAISNTNPAQVTPPDINADNSANYEETDNIISEKLIGSSGLYTVGKNESLRLIAAKLGMSRLQLATMNNLSLQTQLKPGQELRFNNRRIIPDQHLKEGIVINIPDRMLYYFHKGKLTYSTAVALGTPTKTGKFVWHTPTGRFRIIAKEKDPTWTVPPSIQEEMKLEGKEVITSIPPGPGNPLGKYAMKTSLPGILIHSTSKPWSIYTYASHGCIRVYPQWMEELFKVVTVNTPGEIIYKPVKIALTEQGKVLLEVHSDIYSKTKGLEKEARDLIESKKLSEKVDWSKVRKTVSRKSGIAENVTLDSTEAQKNENAAKVQSPS